MVVPWEDWVDLRQGAPVEAVPEVRAYPELAPSLQRLNSPVLFTSKVDVFAIDRDEVDPEIAEASEEATICGLGSYLDVLSTRPDVFSDFSRFEALARGTILRLRSSDLPSFHAVEIIVRPAELYDQNTCGWTLYAFGFGATAEGARQCWTQSCALLTSAFADEAEQAVARFGGAR